MVSDCIFRVEACVDRNDASRASVSHRHLEPRSTVHTGRQPVSWANSSTRPVDRDQQPWQGAPPLLAPTTASSYYCRKAEVLPSLFFGEGGDDIECTEGGGGGCCLPCTNE